MSLTKVSTLILVLLFVLAAFSRAHGDDFVLVVRKDSPVTTLTADTVKRIFLGKKRKWEDGSSITFILNNNLKVHEQFVYDILKKSPSQLSAYWKLMLFSGRDYMPLFVDDDEAAIAGVAESINAISYISSEKIDSRVKPVKILREP
ncbi:MAG: hypothetical protein V1706_11605 [Pseudomonadota bacterium]